ncbi:hypothetical protein C1646_750586 [Rhizophagus diaphanus]|nr:hypothetical protein C1646_750586 [Rhizophagus diaphanus] [Rhizophagus sp. MUCL 43196]
MNFKNFYIKIEFENEGNLNELILKFIGTQNNRAFFYPISSIFKNSYSSLIIKSIKLSSSSTKNSIELDISQILYPNLEIGIDYKIFDKNLKWNFIFEIIKNENMMIFSPLRFDIELNYLCNYLKKIEDYEDKWSHYSYEDNTVAQCSLGSIFRFYYLSKKIFRNGIFRNGIFRNGIFCNGIFNKKFQSKIHVNIDEKKK